jgi:hypothetical protein
VTIGNYAIDESAHAAANFGDKSVGEDVEKTNVPPARLQVKKPGIYQMLERDYHADPAPVPSLSRSIAKLIVEASPSHAYVQHPRLGGEPPSGPAVGDNDMDVGTAAHALFLEGDDKIVHVPFNSYSTNAAKEFRDEALKAGKIPLKTKQRDDALRVVEALEKFRHATGLFRDGKPEQTLIWDEGDHWARSRIDWLPDDPALPLLDLKTTGGLATAATWGRQCFAFGADIQASMYPRGCEFLRGEPPDGVLFVVIETKPPRAIRVFGLDPVAVEVGAAKAAAARAVWMQCLAAGEWPGYPRATEWILPPPWIVQQWESAKVGGLGRAVEDTAFIEKMIRLGSWGG